MKTIRSKSSPFRTRLGFAWRGVLETWKAEASFRTQGRLAASTLGLLCYLKPAPVWWGLVALNSAAVLAAELFNTAIESLADAVHPEVHPLVGRAKDCASAAVLLFSCSALLVFTALLYQIFI